MPLARLLVAAILLSTLAFAQNARNSPVTTTPDFRTNAANPSEPWRIIPSDQTKKDFATSPGRIVITAPADAQSFVISPADLEGDDNTCYAIRSYVVARDSKNSDSTHPVGYSTCQKASRYHVKKVDTAPAPARP